MIARLMCRLLGHSPDRDFHPTLEEIEGVPELLGVRFVCGRCFRESKMTVAAVNPTPPNLVRRQTLREARARLEDLVRAEYGTEYGTASEEERRRTREYNATVMRCVAVLEQEKKR